MVGTEIVIDSKWQSTVVLFGFSFINNIHNKQQKTHKKKREKNKHPSIIGRHIHDHIIDDEQGSYKFLYKKRSNSLNLCLPFMLTIEKLFIWNLQHK